MIFDFIIPKVEAASLRVQETYPFLTYGVVFGISLWGGFVSFIRKVKPEDYERLGWRKILFKATFLFFVEITISTFVGFLTFLLCKIGGLGEVETAALIAIAAHMGTRVIYRYERILSAVIPEIKNK